MRQSERRAGRGHSSASHSGQAVKIRSSVYLTYQPVKILVGATWGHRPHNFFAVGAIAPIAPMESAPMWCTLELSESHWWQSFQVFRRACFALHVKVGRFCFNTKTLHSVDSIFHLLLVGFDLYYVVACCIFFVIELRCCQ